ncbi:hydrolase 1, exosortase A system-associated [Massilia niastensis]|uniref:hydrolase 1, exosortase A system-associated n=1 Tax=Massilia niastensis TaxID=544911 RepID=UPI00036BC745|nr:hydrolase 1, exosortase A system-associated [Massilia niastensis]
MQPEERALVIACGAARMIGILSLPAQSGPPGVRGVVIVVGGPQVRTGSHRQFTLLARALAAAGMPVLRFDYRGMGDSDGPVRNFEDVAEDLRAAIDCFQREVPGLREVVLWGLCDGAAASALYAPLDARVRGLALLNPWARTEEGAARATLKHYYRDRLLDARLWKKIASGRFDLLGAARSFVGVLRSALKPAGPAAAGAGPGDAQACGAALPERLHGALARFDGQVLVLLSGADLTAQEFAGVAEAPHWRRLMAAPRFVRRSLPKADHTCSRREWHDQMTAWTAEWLRAW